MHSKLSFALQGIYAVVTHLVHLVQLVLPVTRDDSAMRCDAMRCDDDHFVATQLSRLLFHSIRFSFHSLCSKVAC